MNGKLAEKDTILHLRETEADSRDSSLTFFLTADRRGDRWRLVIHVGGVMVPLNLSPTELSDLAKWLAVGATTPLSVAA